MANTTNDMYQVFENISGSTLTFGFLGRHGTTLAANATFKVFGGISTQPGWNSVKQADLERALAPLTGLPTLAQKSTPRPVVVDLTSDPAVANPTVAATGVATGGGSTGGALSAGKIKVAYTFVNTWGESTVGTSASAQITVSAGNIPRITVPALPTYATSINLYVTAVDPTTADITTLRRYATGITTTTKDMATDVHVVDASHPVPPTANTTQAPTSQAMNVGEAVIGITDPSMGRVILS